MGKDDKRAILQFPLTATEKDKEEIKPKRKEMRKGERKGR